MSVVRFSVSLSEDLLREFDDYSSTNNFANRSQALRYIIEQHIVEKKWHCNNIVAGALVILYEHSKTPFLSKFYEIQHSYRTEVLSSQHFQMDNDLCLEIIALKGRAAILTELADKLIGIKGVRHGKLIMSKAE